MSLENFLRVLTLLLGGIVGGAMLRFYWSRRTQRGMPTMAMAAFFLMLIYVMRGTWDNYDQTWNWWKTPIALASFICVIIGVWPYLRPKGWIDRHHKDDEDDA